MTGRSLSPELAQRAVQSGELELLDLRTWLERLLMGSPAGAPHVNLIRHLLRPAGPDTIYLCAHAVRSKWTLRGGAAEVEGGFRRWRRDGQPTIGGTHRAR